MGGTVAENLLQNQDALGEYGINVSKGEQGLAVSGSAYFLLK